MSKSTAIRRTKKVLITALSQTEWAGGFYETMPREMASYMELVLRDAIKRLTIQQMGYRARSKGITD